MQSLQRLLDIQATADPVPGEIIEAIVQMRGTEPRACWGLDDCSTEMLSRCPWRIDCGDDISIQWYRAKNEK